MAEQDEPMASVDEEKDGTVQKPGDEESGDGGDTSASAEEAETNGMLGSNDEPAHVYEAPPTVPARKLPTRMYFLRVPRPDLSEQELKKKTIEAEIALYKDACDKALAAAKLSNEYCHQKREEHKKAKAQYDVSKADKNALHTRLQPLREVNRQVSDQKSQIYERKSQLPATTVAQLDAKIEELEFQQAHSAMEKRAENAIIAEMKKLRKARPEVARFEAENEQVEATKDEVSTLRTNKAELEQQFNLVKEEYKVAKDQMDEKWAAVQEALTSKDAVSAEFQRLKQAREVKYKERNALRDELQAGPHKFYENRRFSQKVRATLGEGKVEEAADMCSEVTENLLSELLATPEAWQEYVELWELQRKYAVSEAVDLESGPFKGANGAKKGASKQAPVSSADMIIADIMAEIEGRAPAAQSADVAVSRATAAAAAAAAPAAANGNAVSRSVPNKAGGTAAAGPAKGALPPAADVALPVKAKPAKAKARAAPPAPVGPEIDDSFVPPPLEKVAGLTEAQKKAALRAEQLAKAAEAAERKRKLEDKKVKKAEKAAELQRLREEAEDAKRASDQARIEREAAHQRAAAAKKKEIDARRASVAAAKSQAAKARASSKTAAVSRARPVKVTTIGKATKFADDNGAAIAVAGMVMLLGVVIAAMVWVD